jgi:hypothetical protein
MPKAASASINMSEEIRTILQENPKSSGREARDTLQAKYPNLKINANSFGVAFYTVRKKMGVKGKRTRAGKVARAARAAGSGVSFEALKHAAALVRAVGSVETAMEAIKAVQAVQISD